MQQYCELPSPKGIMRGYFHIPQQKTFPVVLIFHGFTGSATGTKFSHVQLSRLLEAKGIGSIRLDFLGSGESDGTFKDMTFDDELSCARVILEEIKKLDNVTDIYVMGHSMGGAIASELAKLYPNDIKRMCLWAPALNLPDAIEYLKGLQDEREYYDHNGYEVSDAFVKDIITRDLYKDLSVYQNPLLIIHGDKDTTVPYTIHNKYLAGYHKETEFITIKDGKHNFDTVSQIKEVLKDTLEFFVKEF